MPHRWNECASLRREQIESGLDLTFSKVFLPWYAELLSRMRVRTILEVGAGTGHLGKALSESLDSYVAIEPSVGMHSEAEQVLAGSGVKLRNLPIEELEVDRFYDLVLSHLCLQTIDSLDSFLEHIAEHVAPNGSIVFSIPHPCFYNSYKQFIPESEYTYIRPAYRQVSFHITLDPTRPITDVPYFHRPLSTYVQAIASCGFAVTELAELFPSEEIQGHYGDCWEAPRYVAFVAHRGSP